MRIVFIGPPGAGKGTQAVRLVDNLGVLHLSTGDMLRQASRQGSDVGRRAKEYMAAGKLVPDPIILELVGERLAAPDCSNGYLLDGFPRTLGQARSLDELLAKTGSPLDVVLELKVDDEVLFERLAGRGRDDDQPDVIRQRLKTYQNETKPLIDYYSTKGMLESVDGLGTPDEVYDRILRALEKKSAANFRPV